MYGMMACEAYRWSRDKRFLQFAEDTIVGFSKETPPANVNIPARVYGVLISLCLDLHDLTGKAEYLQRAEQSGKDAVKRYYAGGLLRGATGRSYYEAELGVEDLAYALLHLHVRKTGSGYRMEPNYTNR
jgi:hypothetical protein